MLGKLLPSYQSKSKIVDHIHKEQLNFKHNAISHTIVGNQKNKVIRIKNK